MGIRIYKLAEQLELSNKELIKMLQDLGVDVTSHMSTITEETAELIMDMVLGEDESSEEVDDSKVLKVEGSMTVKELSEEIDVDPSTLMANLIGLGIMATINQELTSDQLEVVAAEYGYVVEEEQEEEEDNLFGLVNDIEDKQKDLKSRPPVITVMGHVDHGKTTLLDAIRKTEVTASEAGGITQHIGAYQVKVNGQKITFLDTPGHEAFTSMRARGAQATDIAILVVAADDGIMPQTIEAINHAKSAGVPIIVAINKMDRPNAQPDRVKQELMNHGLIPEDWGGDTVCVPVSALKGENLDDLLEMILLTAEMEELKANPTRPANGIIVEAELDRGRGPVATILIKNGTLKVGDAIVAGLASGRVRAMINDQGERVEEAGPATPVEVLGLSDVPNAGDLLEVVADDQSARDIAQKRQNKRREDELSRNTTVNLEDLFSQIQQGEVKELNIVVKADVQGSVEAVRQSLQKLSTDEVEVKMLHGGVGGITETDVMLAAASNAIIIGFNVRPGVNARKVAEKENVDVRTYRVIYKAIDDVKSAMEGLLDPDYKEIVLGQVEVRQTFKVPKIGTIAGAYVTNGTVNRNAKVRLLRDGTIIHEGEIGSLKRFQDDVKEVAEGYECGIGIEGYNDLKEGDIMEIYDFEEVKRTL